MCICASLIIRKRSTLVKHEHLINCLQNVGVDRKDFQELLEIYIGISLNAPGWEVTTNDLKAASLGFQAE